MCGGELEIMINRIKEEADNLYKIHYDEGYLCEKVLIRMDTIVKLLKQYEREAKK